VSGRPLGAYVLRRVWLAATMVATACVSVPRASPPLDESHFILQLEVDPRQDKRLLLRLVNNSDSTVCVSTQNELWIAGRLARRVVASPSTCDSQLPQLKPGDALRWSKSWSGPTCWPEVPASIEEKRPELRCGIEIEVETRVEIFAAHQRGESCWISSNRAATLTRPASAPN
jgi:hypothetical protein